MTNEGAETNAKILHNLKQLARQRGTDVEGVVLWLAVSHDPGDAMNELLK
jgi:hypothetical protein